MFLLCCQTKPQNHMLKAVKTIVKSLGEIRNFLSYVPLTALTDFDKAIQNAYVHCFIGIEFKVCYFNFKHTH